MTEQQEIMNRIAIVKMAIKILEETEDPRQPEALEHYRAQLAQLEAQIKPPPIVIGLKTARLFGKVGK